MNKGARCPTCKKNFDGKPEWFPFCSERCKLLDLGAWANEKYRIAGKAAASREAQDGQESETEEQD